MEHLIFLGLENMREKNNRHLLLYRFCVVMRHEDNRAKGFIFIFFFFVDRQHKYVFYEDEVSFLRLVCLLFLEIVTRWKPNGQWNGNDEF